MACGCEASLSLSEWKQGICEVCRLQDSDTSLKEVKYCELCKVNICCDCAGRYDRRFFAAIKKQFGL